MRKLNFKKVLFGLSVSLVLAMTIGSFAFNETQTPARPRMVKTQSAVSASSSVGAGTFTVTATDGETVLTDNDYSYASGILTIKSTTPMTIKNTNTGSTTDRIKVEGAATITLAGVNIEATTGAALAITDNAMFNVNITLADGSENTLTATAVEYAGLQKNGASGVGMLTITGSTGENAGKLTATGGYAGAGIGSKYNVSSSNITISGGTVTATGGTEAAGIGGGSQGNGTDITISGGSITATGGSSSYVGGGAGIGGGDSRNGSNIKITGGSITATGGSSSSDGGAGIGGGGNYGSGSNNSISDDNVVVIAQSGGASKAALEGFGTIGKGLIFTKQGSSGSWNYTMYNSVEISGDVEIPTSFTVLNGFTIKNKANLTFASGANITCVGTGKVETLLKYDPQGGSFSGLDDSYQLYQDSSGAGKSYTNLPTPTTNAIFNGWNKTADGTGAKLSESTVDLNLHQAYADMDYTVTFDSQGGSDVSPVSPIKYKSKVTKPTDPTREGYTFDTWYKEESCTNKWDFDKDTVQGDTTLYAKFEANTYNITIPTIEHGSVTSNPSGSAKTDTTVTLTVTPNDGYQLQEGSLSVKAGTADIAVTDKGDGKYSFTMPGAEVTISAVFEQIPTPTPPGPEPTPTPPGPEPGPTPEPTPDPSVDPDGDGGSGSGGNSSKTSDPFMGGVALALLGVATTGAVLVRKRK